MKTWTWTRWTVLQGDEPLWFTMSERASQAINAAVASGWAGGRSWAQLLHAGWRVVQVRIAADLELPMSDPVELKPCPFCGGRACIRAVKGAIGIPKYGVCCERCHGEIYETFQAAAAAAAAWNRRVASV